MKVGLLICTYNRPEYLKECLWSLERADLSRVDAILFVDDCSDNIETKCELKLVEANMPKAYLTIQDHNCGIKQSLLTGYNSLFKNFGCDLVINLDSDAIVRPDFVNKLLDNYFCGILTGFHCTTKNANGTERHKILYEEAGLYVKQSVGGINMCINKEAYEKHVRPALRSNGNWDHNACINAGYAYCLKESVIQHIGFDSSMGHHEQPDVADDFYYWHLPEVTLIGVDSNSKRLNKAKDICTKWIKFGDIVTLNPPISSKEAYSEYCIKELYKHVNTSHMLVFQHDGYVHNWKAWDNSWLQYDYIGSPWWYNDGYNVGNGGFSLRSKRLMEILATDPNIKDLHPEDHVICRIYRGYLESKYDIKFAPLEVAENFAYEGYRQPHKRLTTQFGKHGNYNKKPVRNERYIFNQFLSLGDILFLIPMYRALIDEGNSILWPIDKRYLPIKKHFPDVNFVNKERYNLPYDSRVIVNTPYGKLLPYRFANEIQGKTLHNCMDAKYSLYGHDYKMWRELFWERDKDAEGRLIELVGAKGKFNLVNRTFGHEGKLTIEPKINNDYPIIEMRNIDGFTLIDWLGVVELATEIHASNSSLNYLLELMDIRCPVYLYARNIWQERGFEYTRHLWTNKCFKFVGE